MKYLLLDDGGRVRGIFPAQECNPDGSPRLMEIDGEASRSLVEVADDDPRVVATLHPESTIEGARDAALRAIDSTAESARTRYITPGAGQALTYARKEAQARAYAAAGYSGPVPVLVQATADARGLTAQQAADAIIVQADAWEAIGAAIEQARESGKVAVGTAQDVAAVEAARDATLATLAAI